MMPSRVLLLATLAATVGNALGARVSQAQDAKPCALLLTGVVRGADTTSIRSVITATGARNTYASGGVDATCEGQGNRLLADSAEHFADRGLLILYRNVRYTEERLSMTADKMFYYTIEERLVAEGNVRGRTSSGTRFAGPQMEYYREKPGYRAQASWMARGRPFVRMSPSETGAPPGTSADSVDLTANTVLSVNDSLVWAGGNVIIERSDLRATGDSATLDNGREFARLMRKPQIVGKGENPFTLDGIVIDMWSQDRLLERVLAAGEAMATSDSLVLTADTLDLRLVEQEIERVYAWGGDRARADGPEQQIESDSMDIRMPGQALERVHAVGRAKAYSRVDTAAMVTTERDWIAGDTIIAGFESVPDSSSGETRTRMREVVASGGAQSFYQLAPSGGARGRPNLSYNRGRVITVLFADGEMSSVSVVDQASGLYLEPTAADTVAARPPAARPSAPRRP